MPYHVLLVLISCFCGSFSINGKILNLKDPSNLVYVLFVITTLIMQIDGVRILGSEPSPQLSIVIPTYNEAENIVHLIESISQVSTIGIFYKNL